MSGRQPSQEGVFEGTEKLPPALRGPGRHSNAHPLTDHAEWVALRRQEGYDPGEDAWQELWRLYHQRQAEKEAEEPDGAERDLESWGCNPFTEYEP